MLRFMFFSLLTLRSISRAVERRKDRIKSVRSVTLVTEKPIPSIAKSDARPFFASYADLSARPTSRGLLLAIIVPVCACLCLWMFRAGSHSGVAVETPESNTVSQYVERESKPRRAVLQRMPDVTVRDYYRKDGTYVDGYHRTYPDNDLTNNYSYRPRSRRERSGKRNR
jgi:hypothetical protein